MSAKTRPMHLALRASSRSSSMSAAVVSTSVMGSAATTIHLGVGSDRASLRTCSRKVRTLAKNNGASVSYAHQPQAITQSVEPGLERIPAPPVLGRVIGRQWFESVVRVGVAFAMGNLSEAGESLSILLVNLAGLLTGGVLTLRGARVWARRGRRSSGRNRAWPMTQRGEPLPIYRGDQGAVTKLSG
jgi:hypothetical protein